jgi:hypothetical protein
MTTVEIAMTGVPMIEGEETIETEVAQGMTELEAAQEMTEAAIVETEVTTVAEMKTTPEMTGIVANVATLISHSEQNAIVVGHQRGVAVEVHQNSGLATIEGLAIEMRGHNPVQEIGNAASARK